MQHSATDRLSQRPPFIPPVSGSSDFVRHIISLHTQLQSSGGPNASTFRLPVPSNLNIPEWRKRLANFHDSQLCDFLEFGWPVGATHTITPLSSHKNHGSALTEPQLIQDYIQKECQSNATIGPFKSNPLSTALVTSPMQIARGRTGKLNLAWYSI